MPTYDFICYCGLRSEVICGIIARNDEHLCKVCGRTLKRKMASPRVVIPPQHKAVGSRSKYYGVTNAVTGEGITKNTDVSDPPGIRVKKNDSKDTRD